MKKHARSKAVPLPALPSDAPLLLAVATCPALLIPFASNPFEPHKAAFLWVAAAAVTASVIGSPVSRRQMLDLRGWPQAMLVCAALSCVLMIVSTVQSQAPWLAWWGSGLRRQGTLTGISLMFILVATLVLSSDEERVERLTTAFIVGSVGPTVYAIFQGLGLDPLLPDAGAWSRASSTLGNPLFFGGYLATVWPLALGQAIAQTRRWRSSHEHVARVAGLWIVLGLQSAALIASRSRGPALALIAALSTAGILLLAVTKLKYLARLLAAAAAMAAVLFLIVAPARMRASLRSSRENQTTETASTSAVRLILWNAVAAGIRADVNRLAFGSGPEATTALLGRHAGKDLRWLEGQNTSPDRTHNDAMETLAAFGVAGLMVRLALVGAALAAALAGLGLTDQLRRYRFSIFAMTLLLACGGAAIWRGGGLWAFSVAPAAAIVLVPTAWTARHTARTPPQLTVAISITMATAAWLAHFLEIQLAIETVASSLSAVVAMAIAARVAWQAASDDSTVVHRQPSRESRATHSRAVLVGWSAAVLTIGLAGPQIHLAAPAWWAAAIAWALSLAVAGADTRGVVMSAIVWLGAIGVWLAWGDASADRGSHLLFFYAAAGVCLIAISWWLQPHAVRMDERWWQNTVVSLLAASGVAAVAVRLTSADVLSKAATECRRRGDSACAIALYHDAAERDPSNDVTFTNLADSLIEQAAAARSSGSRDASLVEARDSLVRANAANPFDYHHARNLAALQRRWASWLPAADRVGHLDNADILYDEATRLAPDAGVLWAEWANLEAERGHERNAFDKLERAASLGATLEAALVADAILRSRGEDIHRPGALAQITGDLERRGYPALAALYAQRARR